MKLMHVRWLHHNIRDVFRVVVYFLATYGGTSLALRAFAHEAAAKAYIPIASLPVSGDQMNLEQRLQAVETLLSGVTRTGTDLHFSGVNVYIENGGGMTDAVPNGKGNLIIGYNEPRGGTDLNGTPFDRRTGSHNLIVGKQSNYTGIGGMVIGLRNEIGSEYAVVVGGSENRAESSLSAVFGGVQNQSLAEVSTAVGGWQNRTGALFSTITGGQENVTFGEGSSISGGLSNTIGPDGANSSITGGNDNVVDGERSVIGGGERVEIKDGENGAWAAGTLRFPQ